MSENDTPKKPTHGAYQVNEGQDGKAYFNRIGAAFEHRDSEGYSIHLDSVPVDGKVTLRTLRDRVQQTRDGATRDRARDDSEVER